ncbi:hypothetical protein CRE_16964 [Caenorhabditis remanei]|uniref:HAT C-terminal dimerisation domain-containing protein n=1 Tax=Caenorhabditis remanei TaxID=31234 RepID=E3N2B7_CAERE|nr:hypothetical protein CRE_16964 [Caenorhabditis remanei]
MGLWDPTDPRVFMQLWRWAQCAAALVWRHTSSMCMASGFYTQKTVRSSWWRTRGLCTQRSAFSFYDDITTSDEVDEFDAYMKERVTESTPECPLKYWFSKKDDFPLMSKIAFNLFSTLSSETVCERAFSAVRRVVRDDRQRLNPELIENIMIGFFYSNSCK